MGSPCARRRCTPETVPRGCGDGGAVSVAGVRLTEFRRLMNDEFGAARASAVSRDHVLADLGGRTVEQALEAGIDPRRVWRAVCEAYEVPPARR